MQDGLSKEFKSVKVQPSGQKDIQHIRCEFDHLLNEVLDAIQSGDNDKDPRYIALVKTHLEVASFYAIKGISLAHYAE